ncbi:M56 family metallopeptidase [Desulfococcaceae bacterium HSG8]|nr:M56 family metallopeptidase [Desulfococcaceae bacterium HSG8]
MEQILTEIINSVPEISLFILTQTFYSILLFPFLWGLSFLFRRGLPYWQYGIWALLFVRLVLPLDMSFPISARAVLDNFYSMDTSVCTRSLLCSENERSADEPELMNREAGNYDGRYAPVKLTWLHLFFLLWFLCVTGLLTVSARRMLRYRHVVREAGQLNDPDLTQIAELWRGRFKIRRNIMLVSSDKILSPFSYGLFRPVIYIPEALLGNREGVLHSVISHEIAHIRRLDDIWIKIQNIIRIFYFFNPAVFYAGRQIAYARECICDQLVLREDVISPRDYGNALIMVIQLDMFGNNDFFNAAAFSSIDNIKSRIREICRKRKISRYAPFLIYAILLLTGFFILPLASQNCASEADTIVIQEQTYPDFDQIRSGSCPLPSDLFDK